MSGRSASVSFHHNSLAESPLDSGGSSPRRWAEAAVGVAAGLAGFAVPLVWSHRTPYALDLKWPVLGFCALAAGLMLATWRVAGGRMTTQTKPVVRALGLYLGVAALAAALSAYPEAGLRRTWWHAAAALLFLATATAARRRTWAGALGAVLLASACLVGLVGCLQAAGLDPMVVTWSKSGRSFTLGPGQRVLGTLGLETALGGYMATCAVLALGVALFGRTARARWSAGLAALPMVLCMVFSGTRSAWFAFTVGGVMLLTQVEGRRVRAALRSPTVLTVLATLVLTLGVWGWPMVRDRMGEVAGHVSTRTTIWRAALAMTAERPVLGHGPGSFEREFARHRPRDYARHRVGSITLHAHNEYLDVLAETGVAGGVAFALVIGLVLKGSLARLARHGASARPLLAAATAAVVTMLVHAAFNVDTRYPTCLMVWWMLMGLAVGRWTEAEETPSAGPWPGWCAVAGLAAAVVAAGAIWSSQIQRPYAARVKLREAHNAQRRGDWDAATEHARRAVMTDPVAVPARYTLTRSAFRSGRLDLALAAVRALHRAAPDYADGPLYEAAALALSGDMQAARAALSRARFHAVAYGRFAAPLTDDALRELADRFRQTGLAE